MKHMYYGYLITRLLIFFLVLGTVDNIIAQRLSDRHDLGKVESLKTVRRPGYRDNKKILKEIKHLGKEVTGVDKKVKRVDRGVNKVDKKVTHVDHDIENIEYIVTNIQNQIGDCYDTTVCAELEEIESIVNNIDINVSAIESIVENISDKIGDCTVCETLSIIESKIDALDICNVCDQTSIIESIVENISNKIGGCTLCDELSIVDSKIDVLLIDDACDATPIIAPIMITRPGSYCLANDIVGTITIAADNVNLNLNNYAISSATNGIESIGQNFITVQNGTIHAVDYGIFFTDVASSKIVNCDFQICGTGCGINQSQQIIIDNCRAEANQNGFSFLGSATCVVRNSIALDHSVDGFLFDTCFGTVVTGCIATGNTVGYHALNCLNSFFGNVIGNANGFHGLHSEGGANLRIESSSFDFNTGLLTGVNLRGADPVQTNSGNGVTTTDTSTASGNDVSTSNNNGDGTSNLLLAKGFGNFTNWRSNGNGGNGVTVISSNNVMYEGHFRNNGQCGIAGDSNNGLTLNLTAEGNQGPAGVQVTNTTNLIMSGNYSNNVGFGAILASCPGAAVNQCTVNNNGDTGLHLISLNDFLIQNATVSSSGQNGINAVACQNGQLTGNTVSSSTGDGIFLDPATTNCTTNNCAALSNGGTGINNMGGASNALYANNAKSNSTNFNGVINKYVAVNEIQNRNSDLDILSDVNNLPPQTIFINNPGVYTMTRTFSGQIIINASNVTLDLGGNIITGDFSQTPTLILSDFSLTPSTIGVITVLPGNNNVNILNGIVELVSSSTCPLIGIDINQTNNVTITDFIINNNQESLFPIIGIKILGASSFQHMNYLVVNNVVVSNLFFNNNSVGMQIINCDNVFITQFTTGLNGTGLDIESSVNGVIDNCSISNNAANIGLSLLNCQVYDIKNSSFSLNSIGLFLISCSDCSISNCSSIGNSANALFLSACEGCSITECFTDGASFGIGLSDCQLCVIDNCIANNGSSAGFSFSFCQNCIISNSNAKCFNTVGTMGVEFLSMSDSLISHCFVESFTTGIYLVGAADCSVENCKAMKNVNGIFIDIDSSNCEVKSCVANSNSTVGFKDASAMSVTDVFINNIAHTNNGNNYINISPTTTDRVNGGFYNNLSI